MATTTNYGWTTPDDTGLVKDGALAIRTLGSSIDTTTKNLNPSTTLGDIEYRSSTANTNTRLAIGSTGQVLTVAGGVPSWAAPVSGKVLQVVSATTTTEVTVASTTLTDSGLTATITPTSATSKILVLISQSINWYRDVTVADAGYVLLRGATNIYNAGTQSLRNYGSGNTTGSETRLGLPITLLDSPATTSATTYKTQIKVETTANGANIIAQRGSVPSSIVLMEIGA